MAAKGIYSAASRLKRRYEEPDPFRLCARIGIILLHDHWGTAPSDTNSTE